MDTRPWREWPRNPEIGQPINPADTFLRYRAQSILHGFVDDPLVDDVGQALDVIRWAEAAEAARHPRAGWLSRLRVRRS